MKKVAIVGLGWLGMPLAMSLAAKGWQVTGSKTTRDGVEAARMCGIDGVELRLEPELICDTDELDELMNVDALVITLPARRSGPSETFYLQAVQEIVDSASAPYPAHHFHQLHLRLWRYRRYGERKHRAPSGDRQRPGAERAGRLAAQSARHAGGYLTSGRAGGAGASSGALLCR